MGDGILTSVAGSGLELLVGGLASILKDKASLLRGVHKEVNEIRAELKIIQAFLKDADRKEETREVVKTWVNEVSAVKCDIEDIIDEYMFYVSKHKYHHQDQGFKGCLHRAIRPPRSPYKRHQIATRLQEIKNKVLSISARAQRYGLHQVEEGSSSSYNAIDAVRLRHVRESSMFSSDEDIVGIDKDRDLLIEQLKDAESRLKLNWVVGMGGLGKTTLVAKVYKSPQVQNHFNCCARVTVSQSYTEVDLLRRIINDLRSKDDILSSNTSTMEYLQLVDILKAYLQCKRYVIFLDDVWDIHVWNLLKVAFPDDKCGSRILITTRNKDVAKVSSLGFLSHVFHPQRLGHAESWELFCKKVFWENPNEGCPDELEESGRAIVDKCEGLPLAILAVGGLVSSKEKTRLAWENVEKQLSWELSNNPNFENMKNILMLSFHDLPTYLKPCFLHASTFPEDYQLGRNGLIRMWIAEGFVEVPEEKRRGMTVEEIGDAYFQELLSRSMLQLDDVTIWETKYQMHDFVRDLALSIAKQVGFCTNTIEGDRNTRPRRLSIYNYDENIQTDMTHLRSFMLFTRDEIPSSALRGIFMGFKLLRVLNLENSSIKTIPNEVVELFNLHFLGVRNTKVKELPKCIGRLQNLLTLEATGSLVKALPKGVEKLKKLRHLYISNGSKEGVQAPLGICNLRQLQALRSIQANNEMVKQIEKLCHLRSLGIQELREEDGPKLCASIQKMKDLLRLLVAASDDEFVLKLEALSCPPANLRNIHLIGRMERLPRWIGSLANLIRLALVGSQMKEDPLPLIQSLSHLAFLALEDVYDGPHMYFRAGCFLGLKKLFFVAIDHLEQIVIEKGSMPSVQEIVLDNCPNLKRVPKGIEYLTRLERLLLHTMPDGFMATLQEEDKTKVQHIPSVARPHRNSEGKWSFINLM